MSVPFRLFMMRGNAKMRLMAAERHSAGISLQMSNLVKVGSVYLCGAFFIRLTE
ncbi:hypothetical protein [Paenibacillus sp. MMS18-CY102]|uniref:hypothetical protein n=1 Tax=Paenibacillus sp. MMS18-CY102 TaxID=2682849 RepID=UPI0013655190|nr:hypothetical protein [Paenibacillus sp. MMS18-CY102]MWC30588.1 hypothetical protein [Paenibacillus sp. MMS18-CY102]